MYQFGLIENIPPGSIFLSNGTSRFSELIRICSSENFLRDSYTHGGIYLGGPKQLISHQLAGSGATIQPLSKEISSVAAISIWSAPEAFKNSIQGVINRSLASKAPYSLLAAAKRQLGWPISEQQGLYCIEAILTRFNDSGIPVMGDRLHDVTPNELRDVLERNRLWTLVFKLEK